MSGQQFDMFPDDTPEEVVRYWAAKARWYASGTHKAPTRDEFVKRFEPEISTRTLDRIRKNHRGLVGPWPPRRTDQPPIVRTEKPLAQPERLESNVVDGEVHTLRRVRMAGFDEDNHPVTLVQFYDSINGRLVESFIDEPPVSASVNHLHQLPALAAGLVGAMDAVIDGKLDGVLQVCHMIGRQVGGG